MNVGDIPAISRWRDWEQEADDASAWLAAGPGRGLLVDEFVRDRCFKGAPVVEIDLANRKQWVVVTTGASPQCVARGRLDAALEYVPP